MANRFKIKTENAPQCIDCIDSQDETFRIGAVEFHFKIDSRINQNELVVSL